MAVHLAKGTRDALPEDMSKRLAVITELRGVFANFGFSPLDTPAFERIETLTGKYGEEGAKLIFKILKRGAGGERGECDLALRYDLTVPLARVMAMNSQIRLPFKRSVGGAGLGRRRRGGGGGAVECLEGAKVWEEGLGGV